MIRSSLCHYSDAYIHVKGTITIPNTGKGAAQIMSIKKRIFKNCAPLTNYITKLINKQTDDASDIDVTIAVYNLIEYSKTSGSLWQYYIDDPALDSTNNIIDFPADNSNDSISFKFKEEIAGKTGNDGIKDVEIMVPLKHLSHFRTTLEMPLINCEINLQLQWSAKCFSVPGTVANQVPTFNITDTNLYVLVVTLSTQNNVELLKQLESGF